MMNRQNKINLVFAEDSQIQKGTIITRPKGYFSRSWVDSDYVCEEARPSGRVLAVAYEKSPYSERRVMIEVVVDFGLEGKAYIKASKLYFGGGRVITTHGCGGVAV